MLRSLTLITLLCTSVQANPTPLIEKLERDAKLFSWGNSDTPVLNDIPEPGTGSDYFEASRRNMGTSPEFPCNLNRMTHVPHVLLIGEEHCSQHSQAVRREGYRLGALGGVFFGSEVGDDLAAYPWNIGGILSRYAFLQTDHSRAYGIESPHSHGLAVSYVYAGGGGGTCSKDPNEPLRRFIRYTRSNPHLRKAFDDAAAIAKGSLKDQFNLLLRALEGKPIVVFNWTDAARAVNDAYVKRSNQLHGFAMVNEEPLKPFSAIGGYLSQERVILAIRNRDMSRTVGAMVCGAAAEGKNVIIIVGAAHVPGIAARLTGLSEGRVQPQIVMSFLHSEPLIQAMQAW